MDCVGHKPTHPSTNPFAFPHQSNDPAQRILYNRLYYIGVHAQLLVLTITPAAFPTKPIGTLYNRLLTQLALEFCVPRVLARLLHVCVSVCVFVCVYITIYVGVPCPSLFI